MHKPKKTPSINTESMKKENFKQNLHDNLHNINEAYGRLDVLRNLYYLVGAYSSLKYELFLLQMG